MKKACVLGLQHQETEAGQESNPLEASIDFCTWALCIPRWVLRTKTEFSWHLWKSFSVRWCNATATPTTTFPLPVPHPGCFSGGGPGLPRRQLWRIAKKRLLHVIIYVLNYLYLGRFPVTEEIQRRPNAWQLACFRRLEAVLNVCGEDQASYPMVLSFSCWRSFWRVIAGHYIHISSVCQRSSSVMVAFWTLRSFLS